MIIGIAIAVGAVLVCACSVHLMRKRKQARG